MLFLHTTNSTQRRLSGFTLVEVMVAMVIGMLGIIIMMQMFALFEGQKRTTSGGDDAQNSATIALYGIQQNIQQAGYCFTATSPASAAAQAPTLAGVGALSPVMIDVATLNPIKAANTNTVMVSYGNDSCTPNAVSGVASAATLNVIAYKVLNGSLWQCNYLQNDCALLASWDEIASNIVSMNALCIGGQGVRVALVARNSQLENKAVTTVLPSWSGAASSPISLAATPVDAAATSFATRDGKAAWQYYRYKVIETLAPVRNTLWTGAKGC